jgi:serine/threonine-protein kinase
MSELQEIFTACLNVPAFQREELLGRLCGQNDSLRRRVQRLLEFDQENQDTGFLEPQDPVGQGWANRAVGSCIGPYQITGLVGVGGFGTVYRAQRTVDTDLGRREVSAEDQDEYSKQSERLTDAGFDDPHVFAVKVLHPWLVNTPAFERFRREERALRSVNHPHVARYID